MNRTPTHRGRTSWRNGKVPPRQLAPERKEGEWENPYGICVNFLFYGLIRNIPYRSTLGFKVLRKLGLCPFRCTLGFKVLRKLGLCPFRCTLGFNNNDQSKVLHLFRSHEVIQEQQKNSKKQFRHSDHVQKNNRSGIVFRFRFWSC